MSPFIDTEPLEAKKKAMFDPYISPLTHADLKENLAAHRRHKEREEELQRLIETLNVLARREFEDKPWIRQFAEVPPDEFWSWRTAEKRATALKHHALLADALRNGSFYRATLALHRLFETMFEDSSTDPQGRTPYYESRMQRGVVYSDSWGRMDYCNLTSATPTALQERLAESILKPERGEQATIPESILRALAPSLHYNVILAVVAPTILFHTAYLFAGWLDGGLMRCDKPNRIEEPLPITL